MKNLVRRTLPKPAARTVAFAGLGGFLAIAGLNVLADGAALAFLMAPFGASCVLLFAAPSSPLSQPVNVVGGHFVATLTGLALHAFLPATWWGMAIAVGCAIALMVALRVTHPPAGADPLVVFSSDPGFAFLLAPVLSGAVALVLIALLFHKLSGVEYPARSG